MWNQFNSQYIHIANHNPLKGKNDVPVNSSFVVFAKCLQKYFSHEIFQNLGNFEAFGICTQYSIISTHN